MEENVPLESKDKKKFEKTVSGIKKLIKSGQLTSKSGKVVKSKFKKSGSNRGVVYIGHIPNGFYEDQMRDYFGQFGRVTNVRVARSKRNGRSKGYGFVEFQEREVAEIVAETMNNYLMDKRLLKAECILSERELPNLFKGKNWTDKSYPGIKMQQAAVKKHNKEISDEDWITYSKQQLFKIHKLTKTLEGMNINFNFTPKDIPDELKDIDISKVDKKSLKKSKPKKKESADASSPKSKNTKAKSLKKNVKIAKQPKVKKIASRPFFGVLAPPPTDSEETPKKVKKTKKQEKKDSPETEEIKEVFKKVENVLHKKVEFGGITKKKSATEKKVMSEKKINSELIKKQAKKIMKSDLVTLMPKSELKNPTGKIIKKKHNK